VPAESGASCAFAASIKRAAALREGPLPFAVPVAVNLRRMSLLILISVPTRGFAESSHEKVSSIPAGLSSTGGVES
jgi:hypothetical protein